MSKVGPSRGSVRGMEAIEYDGLVVQGDGQVRQVRAPGLDDVEAVERRTQRERAQRTGDAQRPDFSIGLQRPSARDDVVDLSRREREDRLVDEEAIDMARSKSSQRFIQTPSELPR